MCPPGLVMCANSSGELAGGVADAEGSYTDDGIEGVSGVLQRLDHDRLAQLSVYILLTRFYQHAPGEFHAK